MAKWAWIDGVNLRACYLHGVCFRPKLGEKCSGCATMVILDPPELCVDSLVEFLQALTQ